jgi:hypothetical protein
MSTPPDPRARYFEKQLDDIDLEIVRQAALCGVSLGNRDEVRASLLRVLQNDASVCTKSNPAAFTKLRAAVMMHMTVRDKAIASMGHDETMAIVDDVVARLGKRLGYPLAAKT